MASYGLLREKHLLTIGIVRLLDDRYAALPLPGRVLQLMVTNLRNRPLSSRGVDSMRDSILSLYHNLTTGSMDFPVIPYKGSFRSLKIATTLVRVDQEQRENTRPPPLMEEPAGVTAPAAGSSSAPPTTPTAVHPGRTELEALWADSRNSVRHLEFDGRTVTRVISPLYRSESPEPTNRWRLSDYGGDGHMLMSVLCQFTEESTLCAKTQAPRKRRKDAEEGSSSNGSSRSGSGGGDKGNKGSSGGSRSSGSSGGSGSNGGSGSSGGSGGSSGSSSGSSGGSDSSGGSGSNGGSGSSGGSGGSGLSPPKKRLRT